MHNVPAKHKALRETLWRRKDIQHNIIFNSIAMSQRISHPPLNSFNSKQPEGGIRNDDWGFRHFDRARVGIFFYWTPNEGEICLPEVKLL